MVDVQEKWGSKSELRPCTPSDLSDFGVVAMCYYVFDEGGAKNEPTAYRRGTVEVPIGLKMTVVTSQ